jgi:RHH-type proline utilization regulon transcriptional repressor/proline dehydrogenase/delta 1-pyrroline-5-carboxylate dehydrogenase
VPKFIYLDMEEYRDLQLTAQAFMRTLDRPGLEHVSGGIALQAYVPDSVLVHREINEWAERRVAKGGAPVTIRVVKGANMEAERVDAALHDWPQAPYERKIETDANYKRMLREGMEHLHAVRLGVASHNLFDLAYGLVLASNENAGARMQFEMLEGMANHQRRALLEQIRGKHDQHLLLYAPACGKEEFLNAIGYLLRRLDENTGPENFLRHAFRLEVGSKDWEELERGFREAFRFEASVEPRRTQNRLTETFNTPRPEMLWKDFHNEPDTDWSLRQNSEWAEKLVSKKDPSPRAIHWSLPGMNWKASRLANALTRPGPARSSRVMRKLRRRTSIVRSLAQRPTRMHGEPRVLEAEAKSWASWLRRFGKPATNCCGRHSWTAGRF